LVLQLLTTEELEMIKTAAREQQGVGASTKLNNPLKTGKPEAAAQGIEDRMCVQSIRKDYFSRMAKGVDGIKEEVEELAARKENTKTLKTAEERLKPKEFLHYITQERTSEKKYTNGIRDFGRSGLTLEYFQNHEKATEAKLSKAEVVAMRLYTTHAYTFMNDPLRDEDRHQDEIPCPLPVATTFALDGIKKMRALYTKSPTNKSDRVQHQGEKPAKIPVTESKIDEASITVQQQRVLWRGMRNLEMVEEFMVHGGTELAFMSTTTDVNVAVRYCLSSNSLLFKIVSDNFMTMGADLQWLSAFPGEAEILYPPLTYLKPTGRTQVTSQIDQ
jgi:hypothetical protein